MAAATAPYTTASAFLEHASTVEGLSYTVPTAAPIEPVAPTPLLDQQDHALYSTAFFPSQDVGGNTTGFVLARVIEDAYTLELRWCALSRNAPAPSGVRQDGGALPANAFAELDSHPGTLPPVSFVFPSRLVPTPTFAVLEASGDSGRQLQVFCVTEAGYLYTLTFPLPSLFYAADVLAEGNWSAENRVEALEGRTPVLLHEVDEDRVVIATAEGQLVCAELTANAGRSYWLLMSPGPLCAEPVVHAVPQREDLSKRNCVRPPRFRCAPCSLPSRRATSHLRPRVHSKPPRRSLRLRKSSRSLLALYPPRGSPSPSLSVCRGTAKCASGVSKRAGVSA